MPRKSMLDPRYAHQVWGVFRARRPGTGCRPMRGLAGAGAGSPSEVSAAPVITDRSPETAESPSRPLNPQEGETIVIKLNAGISRKVGEPNYGSRGASINVELELESSAAQDIDLLHQKIRGLFAIAKAAVDEELGLGAKAGAQSHPGVAPHGQANGHGEPSRPAANGQRNGAANGKARPASEAQLRAIRAICERLGADPEAQARQQLGRGVAELSLPEASCLIDRLKALSPNGQ